MKPRLLFVFALLAVVYSMNASAKDAVTIPPIGQAQIQAYPGPQEGAPNIYTQIFDNERVRVSEIKFNPGDKAPMHTHAWAHFVYVLEAGQLTITHPDGTSAVVDAQAGQVLWMPAETHEAVNTGATTLRALVSEIK
jgi:quercetin dioxygenase-like cupin family protein